MNDPIDRQAAIDAVCRAGCGSGFCGVECEEVLALRNMPSAQPETHEERTETHACDLISRQAAEKRIEESLSRAFVDVSGLGKNILKDVPSAQPDIIHCRDCKYYHASYCEVWSKFGTIQTRENGFCYMAERKEGEADDHDRNTIRITKSI